MKVLKGILKESKEYYLDAKSKIQKMLLHLPKGSIKRRAIHGRKYFYLQYRKDKKIIQKYLGKKTPQELVKQIKERKLLKNELIKISEALKIIKRSEGKKYGQND